MIAGNFRAAAAILAILGLIAFSCSDGNTNLTRGRTPEDRTLAEYFEELDAVFASAVERGETLDELGVAFQPGATWEDGRNAINAFGSAMNDFIRDFEAIEPPPTAESLYQQYVDSWRQALDILTSAGAIEDEAEAEAFFSERESEFFSAVFGAAAACEELNILASENQVDVQLPCTAFSAR